MTTQARIGHGALFEIHNGVSYEVIGEITSISHPKLARDAIDASGIGTPGGWREFVPGMKDAGEVTIEMNFVPGSNSDNLLRAQFDTDALTQCRVTFPGSSSPNEQYTLSGIITGYSAE